MSVLPIRLAVLVKSCLLLCVLASALASGTTVTQHTDSTESLLVNGTVAEFKYVTGSGGSGKGLVSQEYYLNGSPAGGTTVLYTSGEYLLSFDPVMMPSGATLTAATLNLVTAVQQAMSLNAPVLNTAKSTSTSCAVIGPGQTGNCKTDPLTNTATGSTPKLQSITIGSTTYTYGSGGASISTLGTINLAALDSNFLVELSNGQNVVLKWTQAVSITGSLGANLGDNMLCKNCTVYYTTTSSASQTTKLTGTLNVDYGIYAVPEPSTWSVVGIGLLLVAAGVGRKRTK